MRVCLTVLVVASRWFAVIARVCAEPHRSSVASPLLNVVECTECRGINNYIYRLGLFTTVASIIN
jgi:hypothetical protein